MAWSDGFPDIAARIRVPVQYTVAEHDHWWGAAEHLVETVPKAFTASPVVTAEVARGSGHNLSLAFAGHEYHQRVLAFAEDCLRRVGR